ncbi:MAG: DUF2461 domain-containing protein [Clostridiales bacterium]|nr:DUF2461 domain-containing protein [Clostridiales bacterium]
MFKGFQEEYKDFLIQLRFNNNREWFHENHDTYLKYVREPLKALVAEMGPMMLSIDPEFDINLRRTISRINRDLRYTRDKSPYRSNMWISFKRLAPEGKVVPSYYFEIFPEYYSYGMGFYNVPRGVMDEIRGMIDERNQKFMKIHKLYKIQNTFTMEGRKYKRIMNKELPEDLLDWYQRKELFFVCDRKDDMILSPKLIDVMYQDFKLIEPIYHFLRELT